MRHGVIVIILLVCMATKARAETQMGEKIVLNEGFR